MSLPSILLFGPTAVGKTDLLIRFFAERGEVISADSMQVYRGMDIGTAKPSSEIQKILPHHLVDIRNPDEQFSAGDFVSLTGKIVPEIRKRGKIPVVSGGTAFYFRNLLYGLPAAPVVDPAVRSSLEERCSRTGLAVLAQKLKEVDPVTAERISPNDRYRLIHGEADGFPGLVVDKFGDTLVLEPGSAGYLSLGPLIAEILLDLYPQCRVAFRPDERSEKNEGVSFRKLAEAYPVPPGTEIRENGLRMYVDLALGHKTGYFLDQRENRRHVAEMAEGKDVWDLFCYTGGFGISAALGKAQSVVSVDLDEKALTTTSLNAKTNEVDIEIVHRNCFDFLRDMIGARKDADLIIVDPAKLAAVRDEIPRALKTYNDINRLAIEALRPGGILVSCSCSGLVSEPQFLSVLGNAAREVRAELQIFRVTGAAPDHPVRTDFPEGRYLKAVFARVVKG